MAYTGRVSSRRRRVAAARTFCRWWSRAYGLRNPVVDLRPPAPAGDGGQDRVSREVVALTPAAVRRMCEAADRRGRWDSATGRSSRCSTAVACGPARRPVWISRRATSTTPTTRFSWSRVRAAGDGPWRCRARRGRPRGVPALGPAGVARRRPHPRPDQARHRDADAVFLSSRGRRLGRAAVWKLVSEVADRAGLRAEGTRVFPPRPAPLLRHPPDPGRSGHPLRAGPPRPRLAGDHRDLHACDGGPPARRLRPGTPAGAPPRSGGRPPDVRRTCGRSPAVRGRRPSRRSPRRGGW